ncbi:uncharacterized protein BO87DRAFT_384238 [Aspergillus neoniger CBS 115656]|uniref:Uncharacterized protein n=1 Tax=Aspergillus neoniger (strain CBS 115656) TaxID=1448310 RepID=A0A318YRV0_ASPNB|nr:hypothetical protein BO87DRAFT_384238 [Aspergillus neoniger CBS 115656]PYH37096.1 hypothetical protein BO87DRAFT_384238 [Aspergillus neoniger CBS 115656]
MDDPQCSRQHKGICNPILLLGDTHDQSSHRSCRLPVDPALRPEWNEIDGEDDAPGYTPLADVAEMHESPTLTTIFSQRLSPMMEHTAPVLVKLLIDIQMKMTLCQSQGQIMPSDQSEARNLHSGDDGPKDDRGPPLEPANHRGIPVKVWWRLSNG